MSINIITGRRTAKLPGRIKNTPHSKEKLGTSLPFTRGFIQLNRNAEEFSPTSLQVLLGASQLLCAGDKFSCTWADVCCRGRGRSRSLWPGGAAGYQLEPAANRCPLRGPGKLRVCP